MIRAALLALALLVGAGAYLDGDRPCPVCDDYLPDCPGACARVCR